ncbi:MAG: hypothetical protein IJQ12_04140 [Lachnospiraceae bacterium]|nr:hypothetical protein [Lachnospiraceae bacterium]
MAIGKERYTKNVIYVGGAPSTKEGYGVMFLYDYKNNMMYYYEYVAPVGGENRDQFMVDVMTHYAVLDGRMRISFVFANNIVHSLSQIVHPQFLGMDQELEPMEEDLQEEGIPGEEGEIPEDEWTGEEIAAGGFLYDDAPAMQGVDPFAEDAGGVTPLAGTENVTHEAIGSVESIADTPIPFELWLFSIKKMGQNFAAANEAFERLGDEDKAALMQEYNETFGF